MAGPKMVVRIAADLAEFKANLLEGKAQIEALGPSVAKLSSTWAAHSTKLVNDANQITAAINKIGPGTLTAADAAKNLRVLDQAMEHLHATGKPVPALMKETADQLRGVAPAATVTQSAFAGLAGQLTGMFTVGALIAFGREVLNAGDHIQKMADQTEMTNVEVQRLMYIAGQSGVEVGSLVSAVQNLQVRLGDEGSGAVGALKKLNINVDDFRKLGAYDQMVLAADGVRAIKDPTDRAEVAAALFGKTWKEILPAIKSGMKDVGDQAITMSDETTKALDKTGDALLRAKGGAVAFAGGIAGVVFKIADLMGGFGGLASPMGAAGALWDVLKAKALDLANTIGGDAGMAGSLAKLPPLSRDVGAGVADITLKGAALNAVYADLAITQEASIERNKREAETQKQIAAAMGVHWNAVGTIIDRVYGVESIAKAKQWQDAIESMGGSLAVLSNKDLADLEAAMSEGIDALVRSGKATSEQTSAFVALQLQAKAVREATLGVTDALSDEARWMGASADAAEAAAERKIEAVRKVAAETLKYSFTMQTTFSLDPSRKETWADRIASFGSTAQLAFDSFNNPYVHVPGLNSLPSRDSGGPVSAGQPYYIGRGAQPELFVPSSAGTMYPAGSGGSTTVNIYVTQPLGTPDAIGRAVIANMKAQGVRLGAGA